MTAIKSKDINEVKNIFDFIENLDSRNFIRQILEYIVDLDIQSNEYINLMKKYMPNVEISKHDKIIQKVYKLKETTNNQ